MQKAGLGILAMAVSAVLLFTPAAAFARGEEAAEYLAGQGVIQGDEMGELRLSEPITRAEMAKLTVLSAGREVGQETPNFADVAKTHWASAYIAAAVSGGFVNGFEDGTFQPDSPVTYEQAAKMVMRAFGVAELAYPQGYITSGLELGYLDGIPAVLERDAARGDVARLLYNAIRIRQEKAAEEKAVQNYTGKKVDTLPMPYPTGSVSGGSGGGNNGTAPLFLNEAADISIAKSEMLLPVGETYYNTEEYDREEENGFKNVRTSPLSTFSIDVDTASYSNMRRYLSQGQLPPLGAVRTEEMINYFDYDYPPAEDGEPFSITAEIGECPWNPENRLALIALKGKEVAAEKMPPQNLVFLIDTSGSMYSQNKLPLVKQALGLLTDNLREEDRIAIVTYAGSAGVALPSTPGSEKETIKNAVYCLEAGGSTAGGAGLSLAYKIAGQNKTDGNNRIILCSDGDFNVGISSTSELEAFVAEQRNSGIYLSTLGFGMGNYKDNRMETLADKGNGNYAYIDNVKEAKKVLVDDVTKTLFTVAEDVKLQIEFNPQVISEYRLVGYENRRLNNEDFDNDKKDAGEMGAGHTVTALYELVPSGGQEVETGLKFQQSADVPSGECMYVKIRYKNPGETESELVERIVSEEAEQTGPSESFRFSAAVAQFGMLLNESEFAGSANYDSIIELAEGALGEDRFGLRAEFVTLAGMARYLERKPIGEQQTEHIRPYVVE